MLGCGEQGPYPIALFFTVKLKMSPLNFRLDRFWKEKVKIYFFINRMCAIPSSFGADSNLHFSPLVKHFNHYGDGHLIRGELDSYSSENNRIKFCWTHKRESHKRSKTSRCKSLFRSWHFLGFFSIL